MLGSDVPDPVGTFQNMQQEYRLHSDIVENIHRAGYVAPTPIQMQAVPVMIHVSHRFSVTCDSIPQTGNK